LFSALSVQTALQAGGGIAATGAKIKGAALIGKNIFTALTHSAGPAAAGTAGAAVAAAIAYAVLAPPAYDIALTGDCDCGHINPRHIEMDGLRSGDTLGEWELLAADGTALNEGSLDSVTDYVHGLEKARRSGHYVLRCVVTTEKDGSYAVSRDITIGGLTGDE
ncbi:MAG: hypothetical protein LBC58_01955, partial [Clostridiales Family XIII bacterium]|nr:hypothetical protein [Clostridiales Family XIII bacterium]